MYTYMCMYIYIHTYYIVYECVNGMRRWHETKRYQYVIKIQ